jgi:predicted ester cyclase
VKRFYQQLRAAFPDIRYSVEDMVAEGDKVTVRWTWRGVHRGEYLGVAPTGREATAAGIAIYRIAGGQCAERWVGFNPLVVLRQLGAAVP